MPLTPFEQAPLTPKNITKDKLLRELRKIHSDCLKDSHHSYSLSAYYDITAATFSS